MSGPILLDLAGIEAESIVDGPGIRFAIFCQGCPHDCPGCHNPATHPFGTGTKVSVERLMKEIEKDPLLKGAKLGVYIFEHGFLRRRNWDTFFYRT